MAKHTGNTEYWRVRQAISVLHTGGVIAYPTEAVWGLGCDPYDREAVLRLLNLKRRKVDKGLILVASEIAQLGELLLGLDDKQLQRLQQTNTERPTTWLLPHHNRIPCWITGAHRTVAIRISHHPIVQALCFYFGGLLVSTSANAANLPSARTELKARSYFGSQVDAYVTGKLGGETKPSSIVDLVTGRVLR